MALAERGVNVSLKLDLESAGKSLFSWSGRQDLNLRPLAPHASALPGCATPRPRWQV